MSNTQAFRLALVGALCLGPLLVGADGCDDIVVGEPSGDAGAVDGGDGSADAARPSPNDAGDTPDERDASPAPDASASPCDDCGADAYCARPSCGSPKGQCEPRPEACIEIYQPVCGCDGETYGNDCNAAAAGVTVDHTGECTETGPVDGGSDAAAPDGGAADAGSCQPDNCGAQETGPCQDGSKATYTCTRSASGECHWQRSCPAAELCGGIAGFQCEDGEFCDYALGTGCEGIADASGYCQPTPQVCTQQYAPVCGCDGNTYSNACTAHAAGVAVADPDGGC